MNVATDTIVAIATAPGGAIGVVRVSGPDAIDCAEQVFHAANGHKLVDTEPRRVVFGEIRDGQEVVDEVLLTVFRGPHSYTGEDSVEISCHGSAYILGRVVDLLCTVGCRTARPGEYTQRAFLNGKFDLCRAEAVADLIAAQGAAAHRLAMNQMRGGVSRALQDLRDRLLHLTTLLELEIDFSDHEDIEFADRSELDTLTRDTEMAIERLIGTFRIGNALKNGIPVAIVGETNAGKSTLLNQLLGEERAIVSPVHGTTRDVVEDTVSLPGGILLRLSDTAGLRTTTDAVEGIGIQRAYRQMERAEVVVWVVDATDADAQVARIGPEVLPRCEGKQLIVALNKMDLLDDAAKESVAALPPSLSALTTISASALRPIPASTFQSVPISAKHGTGLDALRTAITQAAGVADIAPDQVIISNERHRQALSQALDAIRRVRSGLITGLPADLLSEDLRLCNSALGDILTGGAVTPEETLQNVFGKFCIGK